MRVVYKKSMRDKIDQAQHTAQCMGKQIEKIVVTKAEMEDLKRECCWPFTAGTPTYSGTPIETEE